MELPRRWLCQAHKVVITDYVQAGDPIVISLGYNKTLVREFTGYVSEVRPGVPVKLLCQDEMYLLKRRTVKVSYASVTVQQLLHDICPPGTSLRTINADLGQYRAVNVTVAKVLEKLREQYGFVSYYRKGVLYCGRVYLETKTRLLTQFQFERHILEDNLTYRTPDQLRFVVKATNHVLKGKNMQVTIGDLNDPAAVERTLQYFNLANEQQLRAYANADLARLRKAGYEGSFTTYGLVFAQDSTSHEIISSDAYVTADAEQEVLASITPEEETGEQAAASYQLITNDAARDYGSVEHGRAVRLISTVNPERNGDFFVDAVKKSFSQGGYRQEITIGSPASLKGFT